jgi:hypothetical protein
VDTVGGCSEYSRKIPNSCLAGTRYDKVHEWINVQSKAVVSPEIYRTTGFVDIALFARDPVDFRAVVEVKTGVVKGSEFYWDAQRIRYIRQLCPDVSGIVVGIYLNDPAKLIDRVAKSVGLEQSSICYLESGKTDSMNYVYGVIGAVIP